MVSLLRPLLTGAVAAAATRIFSETAEAKMLSVFKSMDTDGSGTVEVKELRDFISSSAVRTRRRRGHANRRHPFNRSTIQALGSRISLHDRVHLYVPCFDDKTVIATYFSLPSKRHMFFLNYLCLRVHLLSFSCVVVNSGGGMARAFR